MKSHRWLLLLILSIYLLLTIGYGIRNPLFEAPDEHFHFFTAQSISESNSLPFVDTNPDPWMAQEAAQPPLYYLISALIIRPIDTQEAKELVWLNPRVQLGDASSPTNINAFVHTSTEDWPWDGFVLAAHLLRMFSTILGLGTLLCIYGSGRLVWPQNPERALLATATVAFIPQFSFLHGSISNDTLIIFLCAIVIWQLVAMWYSGASWPRLVAVGLTIGLAVLSKMAGLLLLLYALIFIGIVLWRDSYRQSSSTRPLVNWLRVMSVALIALLVSGWLLWRNWNLYSDITATSQFIRIAGGDRSYSLFQVFNEWPGLWTSFFSLFGWFNVRAPQWVYILWNVLVVAALVGVFIELVRTWKNQRKTKSAAGSSISDTLSPSNILNWSGLLPSLLALWVLMVLAGLINFMLRTPAAQGRLLYPALVPLALGFSYGLSRYRWSGVYILAPLIALLTSIYCLFIVIPSAYTRPPILTQAEIPAEAATLGVDLGQGLHLLAAEVETTEAKPGDFVWATLYWQKKSVTESIDNANAPQFVLELFGHNDELAGKLQSYHGGGLFPASLWPDGVILADQVAVRTEEKLSLPVQLRLNIKIADETLSTDVGTVKMAPSEWPPLTDETIAQLNGIEIVSADLERTTVEPGDEVDIRIRWQVTSAPEMNFATFVHLGDPRHPPLAQGDNQSLGGHYPTSLWSVGEVIDDSYSLRIPLDLATGVYPIHIGMYDPENGIRLPLFIAGDRQPNDALLVGQLRITE